MTFLFQINKMSMLSNCRALVSTFLNSTPKHLTWHHDKALCRVATMKSSLLSNVSEIHIAAFREENNILSNKRTELYPAISGQFSLSSNYISVRHKKNQGKKGKWAVGPTKSGRSGKGHIGKSRGLKVYDGQRVPTGTLLVNQMRPIVFPGWNVSL